ncbi:MAG TPA: hypothetical protein PK200_11140 [Spirochaetota bacterium]|nr:hypothetical protein [Spirochaetota bacterium]HQO03696.1 hypothetical protein [Spirochaetota bacterium]HQP49567.1 hypothetical protein [Spirochaetota bacterium]
MNQEEISGLSKFIRIRYPDLSDVESAELTDVIIESLKLIERFNYDWEKVEHKFYSELDLLDAEEGLKYLREHLTLYREFKGL